MPSAILFSLMGIFDKPIESSFELCCLEGGEKPKRAARKLSFSQRLGHQRSHHLHGVLAALTESRQKYTHC